MASENRVGSGRDLLRQRLNKESIMAGLASVALMLGGCSTEAGDNNQASETITPAIELASPGAATATAEETPEVDMLDPETYRLRPEPMMDFDTSWSYLRERLSELGSSPQVFDPAYSYADMLMSEDGVLYADLGQLNTNFTVLMNILSTNRELLNPDRGYLVSTSLQDVAIGIRGPKNIFNDSFVGFLKDVIADVPEGVAVQDFVIMKTRSNGNDVFTLFNLRYTNPDGEEVVEVYMFEGAPWAATTLNVADGSADYVPYDQSEDFDNAVQIGFMLEGN